MSRSQFLDGVALSGILPAPFIIFATFIGYVAGGLAGALVMTVAIFAPAFAFTLVLGRHLEQLSHATRLHAFFDGITAAVIGLLVATLGGLVLQLEQGWQLFLAGRCHSCCERQCRPRPVAAEVGNARRRPGVRCHWRRTCPLNTASCGAAGGVERARHSAGGLAVRLPEATTAPLISSNT